MSAAAPLRAPMRGPAALAAARVRGVPLVVLAAVAAAWVAAIAAQASGAASVVHHHDVLADGPPPAGAVLLFLAGWQVMIAAMMLPSSLPLVRMFAAASFPAPGRARAMAAFLGAYALVWATFGTLAFAADTGLHTVVSASPWLERHEWAVAPSVLLLAGAFQFTSLKDACLRSCRHPASFMHRHYKRGTAGAFKLGTRHGLFCVGCCWALMLVMFALGVASLIWMALLTALMVHEKTRPAGARTVPLTGVTLLALGTTLFLWGAAATPAAATLPIGEQFRVSNAGSDGDADRGVFRGPDVAYNPQAGEYLVVWAADGLGTDGEFEVFGQRLSAAGTELGADFRISTTGSDGDADRRGRQPAVAYNAQAAEYLVVWEADGLATDDEFEVFGQRLSASGAELGGDFRISTTGSDGDAERDVEDAAVAHNAQAGEYLVVWEADGLATNNEREVFGQRLTGAGAEVGGDFRISTTGSDGDAGRGAFNPAVTHNPQANEYLVAWIADGLAADDDFELFGQRLSGAGAELGGDFRISTTGADGDTNVEVGDPALAHNAEAGEYLVVWEAAGLATVNELEVFGQRLTAVGAEIGGDFRISTTGSDGDADRKAEDPVVAYNPQAADYLVAWEADGLATDNESEVFGQRLSGAGAELGGQFRISTTGADGDTNREVEEPAMAYNPQRNEYLVAWQADAVATDNEFEIFARRSGAAAPPLGTTEPAPPPPSDTAGPLLSALSLSPARFRAAASGPSIAARVGSRVSYRLSEAAAVLFRVERARPGRRAGGRCVKPRRSNRRARRCTRYVTLRGSFSHLGGAGANRLRFRGRLRARKLRPGRYRLRAVATDAAGNRSRARRVPFRVVKR